MLDRLLEERTKRVLERALEGELTEHLGYAKHAVEGRDGGNSCNGPSKKRVKTDTGEVVYTTNAIEATAA